jgi:hypothetical protein
MKALRGAGLDPFEQPVPACGGANVLARPPVPRESIDFMVCMDLVGHRLGPEGLPDDVGQSLFAVGGERSRGTRDVVRAMARAEPGVIVRSVDAAIIPPLSDYEPFCVLAYGCVEHAPLREHIDRVGKPFFVRGSSDTP